MDEHRAHENIGTNEGAGDDPALHDDAVHEAMRRAFSRPPEEHVAQRHLAAMRSAAAEKASGAATPGGWAGVRERATLRRNPMPALTPRWLATGSALLLAFVLGLAAVNVLPNSAQSVVSETVRHVGLDLPDPDDDESGKGKDKDDNHNVGTDVDETNHPDGDHPDNHGQTVSSVARDDSLEGCLHGEAVSAEASSENNGNEDAPGQSDDDKCDHADDEDETNHPDGDNAGPGGDS